MSSRDEFSLPECWGDDFRMGALFAPFRSKSVNDTHYASKMKFWTNLINSWCIHRKSPIVKISEVKNSFCRRGCVPACLEEVFQHLRRTGILISKEDFFASNETWKDWAVKVLIKNPLQWTVDTVKSAIIKPNSQREISYIHLPVVKDLGEKLLKNIPASQQKKMVVMENLEKWGVESPEVLAVVVHWLQSQGRVAVCHVDERKLVKLHKSETGLVKISEADVGIYLLEEQEKMLEEYIKNLENERSEALKEAKKHLANKMKNLAKISLKKKMDIEKRMEKRAIALGNIQGVLAKIDQAKLDSEILDCYRKGIATLKNMYGETGVEIETVTGTMTELSELLDDRKEIEKELARSLDESLEDELEDELNNLLLKDAPKVPSDPFPEDSTKVKDTDALETRMKALGV